MVPSSVILTTGVALLTGLSAAIPQSGGGTASGSNTVCNNAAELCDRAYNAVTHMGAHNSAFLRTSPSSGSNPGSNNPAKGSNDGGQQGNANAAGNQNLNATAALNAGLRLLQSQVHEVPVEGGGSGATELRLCHTSCALLDAGLLQTWLTDVRVWMDSHPTDVVTLLLVNAKNAPPTRFAEAFRAAGLDKYGFVPSAGSGNGPATSWPTLRSMINANTRMVSFVEPLSAAVPDAPYLQPEFRHVFETQFEVLSPNGFECGVSRPASLMAGGGSAAATAGYMGLLNHFGYKKLFDNVIIPDYDGVDKTNSADASDAAAAQGSLGAHVARCRSEWGGVKPTFVLVDFWDVGDAVKVLDTLNDVRNPSGRVVPSRAKKSSAAATATPWGLRSAVMLASGVAVAVALWL